MYALGLAVVQRQYNTRVKNTVDPSPESQPAVKAYIFAVLSGAANEH